MFVHDCDSSVCEMKVPFPFKFIHSADLHLDSPIQIHEGRNDGLRKLLMDASLNALSKLCDFAIEEKVDFIVLAGDIYDGIERGARAQLSLRRQLLRLQAHGIAVYMAFGNHDPVDSGSDIAITWPDNLFRFSIDPETFSLERDGVQFGEITGVSFKTREERRNLAHLFPDSRSDLFSIAVLHANVGGSQEHGNYAPAALTDLLGKGYDYWALGHIHKRSVLSESPLVIYPGNIQGLHMKPSERGLKGAELVEVSAGRITHSFLPFAQVVFDLVTVDISGFRTLNAVVDGCIEALRQKRHEIGERPLIARVDLVGTVDDALEGLIDNIEAVHQELLVEVSNMRPIVQIDQLDGHLIKDTSLEDLVGLSDVVGELLREFGEWRQDPDRLVHFAPESDLRNALVARIKKEGLGHTLITDVGDLDAAEALLAELLGGGHGR